MDVSVHTTDTSLQPDKQGRDDGDIYNHEINDHNLHNITINFLTLSNSSNIQQRVAYMHHVFLNIVIHCLRQFVSSTNVDPKK